MHLCNLDSTFQGQAVTNNFYAKQTCTLTVISCKVVNYNN